MIKIIIFCIVCFAFISATVCSSQVTNCRLTILDSNHVKKVFDDVTLENFKSDVIIYSESGKMNSVNLKNVVKVNYYEDVKPLSGFIIGGSIGLFLYAAVSIIFAGHGEYKFHQDAKDIVIGTVMSTFIGGIIGGLLQKTKTESVTKVFSGLTLNEARREMKNIFEKGN